MNERMGLGRSSTRRLRWLPATPSWASRRRSSRTATRTKSTWVWGRIEVGERACVCTFVLDHGPGERVRFIACCSADSSGLPLVLQCVREAERRIGGQNLMEYLPMEGSKAFVDLSIKLAYGEDCDAITGKAHRAMAGGGGKEMRIIIITIVTEHRLARLFSLFLSSPQMTASLPSRL